MQVTNGEIDGNDTNRESTIIVGPPNQDQEFDNPIFTVSGVDFKPATSQMPSDFVPSKEQNERMMYILIRDPESDPDEDGLLNRDDPDDDGDGVPDLEDPAPYDPYAPKPWLSEDFRAPSNPAQREALWGPVVEEWQLTNETGTVVDEGKCGIHEYGTLLCDYTNGSRYIVIDKDWTAWYEYKDGSRLPVLRTGTRPREAEEYVADSGLFMERRMSVARRQMIDTRYFYNSNVTLYVPQTAADEILNGTTPPSAMEMQRLTGFPGGPTRLLTVNGKMVGQV